MYTWVEHHQVIAALALYYVVSSAIGTMPTPDEKSGKFYQWLFAFLHTLAANASRIPAVRTFVNSLMNNGKGANDDGH